MAVESTAVARRNGHATTEERVAGFLKTLLEDPDLRDTLEAYVADGREADGAPWSAVPIDIARQFIAANPEAALELVFPTVYEEDRTAKLQDLTIANSAGAITHQRMSEQMAKELGFEEYNYAEEQAQIKVEERLRAPAMPQLGAGDQLARTVVGANGAGLAQLTPGTLDDAVKPKRAALSGPETAQFRRQQREAAADPERLAFSIEHRLDRVFETVRHRLDAAQVDHTRLIETVLAILAREPAAPPVINVRVPAAEAAAGAPSIVEVLPPVPRRRRFTPVRDERGLIVALEESYIEEPAATTEA